MPQFQTMMSELSVFNRMGDHSFSTRDVTVLKKDSSGPVHWHPMKTWKETH